MVLRLDKEIVCAVLQSRCDTFRCLCSLIIVFHNYFRNKVEMVDIDSADRACSDMAGANSAVSSIYGVLG